MLTVYYTFPHDPRLSNLEVEFLPEHIQVHISTDLFSEISSVHLPKYSAQSVEKICTLILLQLTIHNMSRHIITITILEQLGSLLLAFSLDDLVHTQRAEQM